MIQKDKLAYSPLTKALKNKEKQSENKEKQAEALKSLICKQKSK